MEMIEVVPGNFDEGYINQMKLGREHKMQKQLQKNPDLTYLPMECLLDDQTRLSFNEHKKNQKMCNKQEHPIRVWRKSMDTKKATLELWSGAIAIAKQMNQKKETYSAEQVWENHSYRQILEKEI